MNKRIKKKKAKQITEHYFEIFFDNLSEILDRVAEVENCLSEITGEIEVLEPKGTISWKAQKINEKII